MKQPWQRFTKWESGVADFWTCGGDIKPFPGLPRTLAGLLKRPEWKGASVREFHSKGYYEAPDSYELVHPSGAKMRILKSAFSGEVSDV